MTPNLLEAYDEEIRTLKHNTPHILYIHLVRDHKSKIEKLNGELRGRDKTMTGLEKTVSISLKDYQLYHDYFIEYEGLVGKTPAEVVGIKIEGDNKWITVIQYASKFQN